MYDAIKLPLVMLLLLLLLLFLFLPLLHSERTWLRQ
jgi:hypothetical protein